MSTKIFQTLSSIVLIAGFLVAYTPLTSAQESTSARPELRVPWAGEAGFGFTEPDGTPRSFFIDLARMIADEAGFDIRLMEYPSDSAVTQSIQDGEADFLAGAGGAFAPDDVLVAGPIAQMELRLYVRGDAPLDLDFATFDGDRIGAVRRTLASRITPLDGGAIVEYDDQITAFGKLLAEEVDGVLAFSPFAYRTLKNTQLDTLIRPTGAPIRTFPFFAVLRREHVDLMPRIETAIATLEHSGALEALRNTWFMVPQTPIPEVLTVGVVHFPPYYIVEDDGAFSGFALEVIRELADRAGLALRYKEISLESWAKGPRVGAFDLLPARSVTMEEGELFEFTVPIQTIDYVAFVRPEDAGSPLAPRDGRIGILTTSPLRAEIATALGVNLVDIDSAEVGARGLGDETIDALFYPRAAFENHLRAEGASARFVRLPRPEFRNDLAIATRPGLGDLDEQLNVVIQGFVGSAQYRDIASRWFDLPPFWTPARIRLAEITATAIVGVAILCFLLIVLYGRRQALLQAKATESISKRLGAVLDTTQNSIVGFDHSGRIIIANHGVRAMIPELESDGPHRWPRSISFLDPDDRTLLEPARDPVARALSGSDLRGDVYLMSRNGSSEPERYIRISSSSPASEDANEIATVVSLDDVSELFEARKSAEQQARIAAAAQKQESIGKLTGGVAHDFNNLLAVVLGNLELLQEGETEPDRSEFAQSAIDATLRGAELVRNMLAFARRSQIDAQVLDLNESVQAVQNLAARTVPASVKIETSMFAGLWKTRADRALTENALLNLVLNANDAMQGAGRLTIETKNLRIEEDYIIGRGEDIPVGRYVMLAVTDTGPGIPEEALSKIFEPFYTTKGPQGGTGLGLSMVQGFIKQTGGTVRVYSELGVGTSFKLFFPITEQDAAVDEDRPLVHAPASGSGERILLTEDQANVLGALRRTLERGGYTVVAAESGDRALEIFELNPDFDLVVTDIVMPGRLQGPMLVKELRHIKPDLPAVFMSGYAEEATAHGNGLKSTDIRLMKPVARSQFLSAVKAALALAHSTGSEDESAS